MIASDATVSFILNKIQNPGWSGTTPDFRIAVIDPDITEEQEAESLAARQQALDDDQEVDESAVVRRTVIDLRCPGNSIQAGSLENCSIVLEKLKVKKVGSARISFECFNSVPGMRMCRCALGNVRSHEIVGGDVACSQETDK